MFTCALPTLLGVGSVVPVYFFQLQRIEPDSATLQYKFSRGESLAPREPWGDWGVNLGKRGGLVAIEMDQRRFESFPLQALFPSFE